MAGYRQDRLNEDIRRELSDILRGIKDPRVTGIVSIVRVEVSGDLSYAKVFISSIGSDPGEVVKGLSSAAGFIRRELSGRMHIRKTPELQFFADRSIEKSVRISKLINDLHQDGEKQ